MYLLIYWLCLISARRWWHKTTYLICSHHAGRLSEIRARRDAYSFAGFYEIFRSLSIERKISDTYGSIGSSQANVDLRKVRIDLILLKFPEISEKHVNASPGVAQCGIPSELVPWPRIIIYNACPLIKITWRAILCSATAQHYKHWDSEGQLHLCIHRRAWKSGHSEGAMDNISTYNHPASCLIPPK